jgi:hypothetical protein
MDLIARYLQAVKFWLPRKQQDDIIAELSEDLRAQVEEREAQLGRKLNELEVETLLRQRGSPVLVANRYLPQQSLIGPVLFPIYVFVLKLVTLVSLIPALVGFVAGIVSRALGNIVGTGWTPPFSAIASHFWSAWFSSLTVVTILFAVLERTPVKTEILEKWNPRKLPALRPTNSIPRSGSIIEVSVNLCALAWWATKMAPPTAFRFGNLHVAFAPVWSAFYWAMLFIVLASTILSVVNLIRPWWTTQRAVARLLIDTAGGVFLCWIFQAHLVASLSWPSATPDKVAYAITQLNLWIARIFPWSVAAVAFFTAVGVWRLLQVMRRTGAAQAMRTALV